MSILAPSPRSRRRVAFAEVEISPEAQQAAARVLASGWVTTGHEVVEFEREFAAWIGVEHAIAVSSCTAGIELSLRSLRLRRGARVLTSTLNFCGVAHAIVHAGLEPVVVDVNPDSLMPDAATVRAAVRRVTSVDAMVVLHYAGLPAPVETLAAAAGLPLSRVVEDAAHALGTWVGDRPVGSISAATCFSFYATKNLPIGEGGMITTADRGVANFVRQARLHGMSRDAWNRYLPGASWRYSVDVDGLKANMTDVQAAIGRGQLGHLAAWQTRRDEIARRYDDGLSGIDGLSLPARPDAGRHAWHLYVVRVQPGARLDRDALIDELRDEEIDCSVHFIPLHQQPYFRQLLGTSRAGVGSHPGADRAFERIVSLPLHPALRDDDVDRVCETIARLQRHPSAERRLDHSLKGGAR